MKPEEQKPEINIKELSNHTKIGERFEYNGVTLEVAAWDEDEGCSNCYFYDYTCSNCNSEIKFKLVEQCETKDAEQKSEIPVADKKHTTKIEENTQLYGSFLNKLFEFYKTESPIYVETFSELFNELGIDYIYSKIREKINYIKILHKHPNIVKNENLENALLDIAEHIMLTLIELKNKKQYENN